MGTSSVCAPGAGDRGQERGEKFDASPETTRSEGTSEVSVLTALTARTAFTSLAASD